VTALLTYIFTASHGKTLMQRCHKCGFKGATIGCMDFHCTKSFHLPCCGQNLSC